MLDVSGLKDQLGDVFETAGFVGKDDKSAASIGDIEGFLKQKDGPLKEGSEMQRLLSERNVSPAEALDVLRLLPSVDGKIDPEQFKNEASFKGGE